MTRQMVVLLGCAALAACNFTATGSDRTEAQATPSVEAAAMPTSRAAATPVDANVLTPTGWGPLRIGMTRAEVETALGKDSNPEAVGGPEPESCDVFHPARAPDAMQVMIEDGRLSRIELLDRTDIGTVDGFTVGDQASAIKAKLGAGLQVEPHKYAAAPAEYLTHWQSGAGTQAYVQNKAARGIRYEIGDDGTVTLIFAGGPSIQYVEGCL